MADFDVNKRLKFLITEVFKMTPHKFSSKYNDVGGVKTSQVIRERNGLSSKLLIDILKAYPEVNKTWLLTGEGEPTKIVEPINTLQDSPSTYHAAETIKEPEIPIDQSMAKLISMMQQLIDNNQIIAESNKILAENNNKTVDSLNLISQSNKSLADSTSQTAKSFESISESNLKLTETNQLLVKSNSELVAKFKAGRMDVQDAGCADVG